MFNLFKSIGLTSLLKVILLSLAIIFCLSLHLKNTALAQTNADQAIQIGSLVSANSSQLSTIDQLQTQLALNEKLAVERVAKVTEIETSIGKVKHSLDVEIKEGNNEQIIDWVDDPLPDFVASMFKQAESGGSNRDGLHTAAKPIYSNNTDANIFWQNQSRSG